VIQQEDILAQARSFMRSRVILTAAELDLFTRLDREPAAAADLASAGTLDERALTRVLDVLVTFGLLEKEEGRYRLTPGGAFLSSNHPETVLPMVLHYAHVWNNWHHLTGTVRRGVNTRRHSIFEGEQERIQAFIGGMHVLGRALSQEIAGAYDAGRFRCLLDIGGGSGSYTIALLGKNPGLRAVLFDQASVVPLAEERLTAEGVRDRVEIVPGDFYQDELPKGCDLALLSAIIHQNSPDENLDLYRKIHRALAPAGVLLIRDHIMDPGRTRPPAGAMFALNMLVGTDGGDTYTFEEVREGLEEAGFQEVRLVRQGERMDCLVEATRGEGSSP
jgi:SAM-dependent methyltransferase